MPPWVLVFPFCEQDPNPQEDPFSGKTLTLGLSKKLDRWCRSSLSGALKRTQTALNVLFPKARAEVLRVLFASPPKQRYVRELRAATGLALSTVQHELRKLRLIGVVTTWSNGYHRFYSPNLSHPLVPNLIEVVAISAGSKIDRSILEQSTRHRARRQSRPVRRSLPPSRPPSWGIFRPRRKT